MESIYVFLIRNDVWIYILATLGLFWYLTELWRARNILRRAMFGLERENGARMRNNALVFILLFGVIIVAVFYVNTRIAPTLPADVLKPPTPTPDVFRTPLAPPTPIEEMIPEPSITPPLVATVTLPANQAPGGVEVTIELAPTETAVPPTPFVDCTLNLNVSQPANGAIVRGNVSFFGTVETEDLQYYTLEINGPQTNGQWADLLGRRIDQSVTDSFLGSANLSQWEPGPYLVRLTAVDNGENLTGQCVIQVTIDF